MIEKEYEKLRSYCFSAYYKTYLKNIIPFDDFFNDFIVYVLKYNLVDVNYFWQHIKRQLKSFIIKTYKSYNSDKRKDCIPDSAIYIEDYNQNHADDSYYAYEDNYSIELELLDLPDDERRLLMLKLEGYTFEDIAKIENESFNHVKTKFYNIRNKLRKEYVR